ncbi:unnamed protein product [Trichogramma brassicae]|uniref:Bromodomain protein 4 C-terminal domain-containing protein n=1 Tax=Trichogramma brassicae TaxID=86971 RepID=A0A6H5IUN5_9HYME|nr:unnamed protein product [Trichogramma brassicae]
MEPQHQMKPFNRPRAHPMAIDSSVQPRGQPLQHQTRQPILDNNSQNSNGIASKSTVNKPSSPKDAKRMSQFAELFGSTSPPTTPLVKTNETKPNVSQSNVATQKQDDKVTEKVNNHSSSSLVQPEKKQLTPPMLNKKVSPQGGTASTTSVKNASSWSSLAQSASPKSSTNSNANAKDATRDTFQLFKKAAKEKQNRQRALQEQQEQRRAQAERERAERHRLETERKNEIERKENSISPPTNKSPPNMRLEFTKPTVLETSTPPTTKNEIAERAKLRKIEQEKRKRAAIQVKWVAGSAKEIWLLKIDTERSMSSSF